MQKKSSIHIEVCSNNVMILSKQLTLKACNFLTNRFRIKNNNLFVIREKIERIKKKKIEICVKSGKVHLFPTS